MRTYFRVLRSVVTFMNCISSPLQRSLIANISCIQWLKKVSQCLHVFTKVDNP